MPGNISIARAGQELGTWHAADIQQMLADGVLTPEDHFWREGMADWEVLACFGPVEITPMTLPQTGQKRAPEIGDIGSYSPTIGHVENTVTATRPRLRAKITLFMGVGLCLVVLAFTICWMNSRSTSGPGQDRRSAPADTARDGDQQGAQVAAASGVPGLDLSSAISDASSEAVPAKGQGRKSELRGLTVKGICIGMDGTEAAKALIAQGEGKLEMRPIPAFYHQIGLAIYRKPDSRYNSALVGKLCTDPKDNTVINIIMMPLLSNLLFNTADQSAEEFAQNFIDAYNVPTITPTGTGPSRAWSYPSSEGWTLYIYPDKSVQILRNPDRKFD